MYIKFLDEGFFKMPSLGLKVTVPNNGSWDLKKKRPRN